MQPDTERELDPELESWVSATQIETFEDCNRKWAFRWIEYIRPPPDKAKQFGLDTHGFVERWLKFAEVPVPRDKDDRPAKLAQQLVPLLPTPQEVDWKNRQNVESEELIYVE